MMIYFRLGAFMILFLGINHNIKADSGGTDLGLFFGRFHPLIVHLPIGFLLLALIFGWMTRKEKHQVLQPAFKLSLLLGFISAALALVFGFLLARSGDYSQELLLKHQWAGIILLVFTGLIYFINTWLKSLKPVVINKINALAMPLLLVMLILTGHYGGNLTHGTTYLTEHAPGIIKKMAGHQAEQPAFVSDPAQALVFKDVVHPIITAKCKSCHNPDKKKGELVVTDLDALLAGGENGPVLLAGNPDESDLIRRVHLPEDQDGTMPPEGKTRLSEQEKEILTWWVEAGLPVDLRLTSLDLNDHMKDLFAAHIGQQLLDSSPENKGPGQQIPEELLTALRQNGFNAKLIALNSHWIEVDFSLSQQNFGTDQIESLIKAKHHIRWLYLNNSGIQDAALQHLNQLTQLSRLRLDNNPITDQGIKKLTELNQLEYLNLYNTNISDQGLDVMTSWQNLKKIYLWQTAVTEDKVRQLRSAYPQLEINRGIELISAKN